MCIAPGIEPLSQGKALVETAAGVFIVDCLVEVLIEFLCQPVFP